MSGGHFEDKNYGIEDVCRRPGYYTEQGLGPRDCRYYSPI